MAKGKKNEEVIVEAPVVEEVITPAKHPLAEKLTTIGEQITASGMFLNHASFIEDLSDWIAQDRGRFEGYSMRQIFEDFSDHSQMFVTEKDVKWSEKEMLRIAKLGAMRIYGLKAKIS